MLGVLEFAPKAVFGKNFADSYLPVNLSAVGFFQDKHHLGLVVHIDRCFVQGFETDAVVR